jgi:GT2 family glycosyltransferase
MTLTIVTATRDSREQFEKRSALAQSLLTVHRLTPLRLRLFSDNRQPLPHCYNQAIAEADPDDVLVFVHDDVAFDDWMLGWRLQEALLHFDVVGVAGNRRRQAGQLTWVMLPDSQEWDRTQLSGAVMHGQTRTGRLTYFGDTPAEVVLLDGVLIAARAGVLQSRGVKFDPRFDFHFYDLDFCRTATQSGLKLGTWPLAITHASTGGGYFSADWHRNSEAYLEKWGA